MTGTLLIVAIDGAIGSLLREFLMLTVGTGPDGFPIDILTANVVASFLLGLAFALHSRKVLREAAYILVGTGIMGGLSTFSSFVLAAVQLAEGHEAVSALVYVISSLIAGYAAVRLGLRLGGTGQAAV